MSTGLRAHLSVPDRRYRRGAGGWSVVLPGGDDWNFQLQGIPGAMILYWRQQVYHKPTDTVERVDWQHITDMVDATLALIRQL